MASSRLSEVLKVDVALDGQSISTATASRYFSMEGFRKALFVWEVGALTAVQTSVAKLVGGTTPAGGTTADITGATATISNTTGDTLVGATSATITAATAIATNTVVINGLTFEGKAGAAVAADRLFSIDTGNDATATSLAAVINDATYGVPGVTATAASAVVTLVATEPGGLTIDVVGTASTLVPAITAAVGYLEIDADQLGTASHVAISIVNTGAQTTSATLVRSNARLTVDQAVGAGKAL